MSCSCIFAWLLNPLVDEVIQEPKETGDSVIEMHTSFKSRDNKLDEPCMYSRLWVVLLVESQPEKPGKGFLTSDYNKRGEFTDTTRTQQYRQQLKVSLRLSYNEISYFETVATWHFPLETSERNAFSYQLSQRGYTMKLFWKIHAWSSLGEVLCSVCWKMYCLQQESNWRKDIETVDHATSSHCMSFIAIRRVLNKVTSFDGYPCAPTLQDNRLHMLVWHALTLYTLFFIFFPQTCVCSCIELLLHWHWCLEIFQSVALVASTDSVAMEISTFHVQNILSTLLFLASCFWIEYTNAADWGEAIQEKAGRTACGRTLDQQAGAQTRKLSLWQGESKVLRPCILVLTLSSYWGSQHSVW